MRNAPKRFAASSMAAVLLAVFAVPNHLVAQSSPHLVSPSDLQKAVVDAAKTRRQNLDTLNNFLSSGKAKEALESANIDPEQVKKAVAGLSDEDLAKLAARAQKAQADFAAGTLGDRDLLIILLCIAALILIIVAVR